MGFHVDLCILSADCDSGKRVYGVFVVLLVETGAEDEMGDAWDADGFGCVLGTVSVFAGGASEGCGTCLLHSV
jgi:hypothetical protein